MSRRHVTFACEGSALVGTLDRASGGVGLLIVSGGNETRAGAFSGNAHLAARIASAGYPVFRFDRRGVGDSEGDNGGFRRSAEDIGAALAAFRGECPALSRIVAFGNCDAASALMLAGGAGCDGLVLSNPWTFEDDQSDAPPPPAAIRARYAEKLKNPRELLRLLRGQVDYAKLLRGLAGAVAPPAAPSGLAGAMAGGVDRFTGPTRILIAERDRTGQAFLAGWNAGDPRVQLCPAASHAYVETHASEWLFRQLMAALADEQARQLDVG
ncbi:hydrolase 1, exosortase A system-associated [Altererythrobacter soli]|uniref:Hydrolase 1, exosortase A system-associated n=1 Tax=Croceibacterium soli TaxID=1739690 RepID=A0A6I4UXU8_9SPHN|nr:hydrolase 1, exosortase A system-associated [Croceibacterium soli]MXP42413.1 hydrolase 1, exosortase A system-associated [Croceibacterium soli]